MKTYDSMMEEIRREVTRALACTILYKAATTDEARQEVVDNISGALETCRENLQLVLQKPEGDPAGWDAAGTSGYHRVAPRERGEHDENSIAFPSKGAQDYAGS